MTNIVITGSSGLIGRELTKQLEHDNHEIVRVDTKDPDTTSCDIGQLDQVASTIANCAGIINLAAVSRVADAEDNPSKTWSSNVIGTANILNAVANLPSKSRPWVIHASSREVYGDQPRLPITEDTPFAPLNVYGRSKVAGEYLASTATDAGVNVTVLRFANVYGSVLDYENRVIPAFARAAMEGAPIYVHDPLTCMDFTHVTDVCRGVLNVVNMLINGANNISPIHFSTGQGTTLGTLAEIAVAASGGKCVVHEQKKRQNSVDCFIGDPTRARTLLNWTHETPLELGFNNMVRDFSIAVAKEQ